MKAINYYRGLLALLLLLAVNSAQASGVLQFNAQGVGAPSFPFFSDNNETVRMVKHGRGDSSYWTLSGSGSVASFWGSSSNYLGLGGERVTYQANFDSHGNLITASGGKTLTNFLQINGSLPAGAFGNTSWNAVNHQLLLSADLTGYGIDNSQFGGALGFKTAFTGGWAINDANLLSGSLTGGSSGENLWLYGLSAGFQKLLTALNANDLNTLGRALIIRNVSSIASVPVPGAVWLFATGLAGLFALRKKPGASGLTA